MSEPVAIQRVSHMTADMNTAYAYYRVSTERQGKSGLGLEAQEQAVNSFCTANGIRLMGEFVEVESGKRNNRPVLNDALATCKKQHALLLIAKLDRLGRNVAFITMLMESKVDFKAVDNPNAHKVVVQMMAVFAEHERDMISQRTIAALQAAKLKGVILGKHGRDVLSKLNHENAKQFALDMTPLIERLKQRGLHSVRAITGELNRLNVPTYRQHSHKWHIATVHQLLQRISEQQV